MALGRKGKVALAIVGALGFLGLSGYLLFQPHIRFATEEEIRAQIDPALLEPVPADEEAQKRMGKADAILGTVEVEIERGAPADQQRIAEQNYRALLPALLQLEEISEEGPLQLGYDSYGINNRNVVLSCTRAALNQLNAGDVPGALERLEMGSMVAVEFCRNPISINHLLRKNGSNAPIDKAAVTLAVSGKLNERQLERLLESLPSPLFPDSDVRAAIRGEYQSLLSVIDDLRSEGEADEDLYWGSGPLRGSYDAIETARFMNRIILATYNSVGKPYDQIDLSGDDLADKLAADLPQEPDSYDGIAGVTAGVWYAIQLNRAPNTVGRSLFMFSMCKMLMEMIATANSSRELARGAVAVQIYRKRYGRYPPDLQAIVAEGILPSTPMDYFKREPLRYDANRKRIWSVGVNMTDEGGGLTSDLDRKAADFGVLLASSGP